MNPDASSSTPPPGDRADHERMSDWDAAYVLGALSPADRREFEHHLDSCPRCRASVADLAPMPGLLARVAPDDAIALLDPAAPGVAPGSPTAEQQGEPRPDLVELVRLEDRRRRRRTRLRLVAGLAAAAAVAGAIALPLALQPRESAPTETVVLEQVRDNPLAATIELTSMGWGTKIGVECSYDSLEADVDPDREWAFALWLTDADGTSSEVSTWSAKNGWTVRLDAATAVKTDDIRTLEIRSLATGDVLLTKSIAPGDVVLDS